VLLELAGGSILSQDDVQMFDGAAVQVPDLENARNIAKKYWAL